MVVEEITHYIPIEDIPMPKANNMLANSMYLEYYSRPYRAILDESGNIIFIKRPYNLQNTNTAS